MLQAVTSTLNFIFHSAGHFKHPQGYDTRKNEIFLREQAQPDNTGFLFYSMLVACTLLRDALIQLNDSSL